MAQHLCVRLGLTPDIRRAIRHTQVFETVGSPLEVLPLETRGKQVAVGGSFVFNGYEIVVDTTDDLLSLTRWTVDQNQNQNQPRTMATHAMMSALVFRYSTGEFCSGQISDGDEWIGARAEDAEEELHDIELRLRETVAFGGSVSQWWHLVESVTTGMDGDDGDDDESSAAQITHDQAQANDDDDDDGELSDRE